MPTASRLHQVRRQVHARPELAFTEIETAALVIHMLSGRADSVVWGEDACDTRDVRGMPDWDELEAARDRSRHHGVPDELIADLGEGQTAVIARIRGTRPGATTAIRFDMDALPIREACSPEHSPHRHGFASEFAGRMHACGHDGHVAIGIELGLRLAADRDFAGELVLLFQPAEEGVRGAATMVAAGAAASVDRMVGLHLGIGLPVGTVAASARDVLATEKWVVNFVGRAAHAALSPEVGRHAVLGAAQAAVALHTVAQVGHGSARINVGLLRGGTATNIVPEEAELWCEVRATDPVVFDHIGHRARDVVYGSAATYGLEARIEVTGRSLPIRCDQDLANEFADAARDLPSVNDVLNQASMLASDDITVLMHDVQERGGSATLLLVGAGSPAPHHHERFDLDERSLDVAVDWLERVLRSEAPVRDRHL